jgi:DNA-directed RNA polymerase specialized sigma24 family protein
MSKKIFIKRNKEKETKEGISSNDIKLLETELLEVKEIADIIFKKIEDKVKTLKALEDSANEKIEVLRELINQAESVTSSLKREIDRRKEVILLSEEGLNAQEIADKLGITVGEVELILNLNR